MEDQSYQTYTDTKTPSPTPLYTEQPKKKSNTWWIVLIVVLVLLCCCAMAALLVVLGLVASGEYQIDWTGLLPVLLSWA